MKWDNVQPNCLMKTRMAMAWSGRSLLMTAWRGILLQDAMLLGTNVAAIVTEPGFYARRLKRVGGAITVIATIGVDKRINRRRFAAPFRCLPSHRIICDLSV